MTVHLCKLFLFWNSYKEVVNKVTKMLDLPHQSYSTHSKSKIQSMYLLAWEEERDATSKISEEHASKTSSARHNWIIVRALLPNSFKFYLSYGFAYFPSKNAFFSTPVGSTCCNSNLPTVIIDDVIKLLNNITTDIARPWSVNLMFWYQFVATNRQKQQINQI